MTKSELMEALAESRGLSRRTAEEVVNVIFDGMRPMLLPELLGFFSKIFKFGGVIVGHWVKNIVPSGFVGGFVMHIPFRCKLKKLSQNRCCRC